METQLTPQESIEIIQRAMREARASFMKLSPFFLVWGIVFITAGLVEFYLKDTGHPLFWTSWPVAAAIGGVLVAVLGYKHGEKQAGNTTIIDRLQSYVWGSYGVALVLVLYITLHMGVDPNPFVMLLTGIPTFITGASIRFAPMKFGAIAFWVGALLAVHVPVLYSGLIFSIALFFGYLLPGFLLKHKENAIHPA